MQDDKRTLFDPDARPTTTEERSYLFIKRGPATSSETSGCWRASVPFRVADAVWAELIADFDDGLAEISTIRTETVAAAQQRHKGLLEHFYADVMVSGVLYMDFYVDDCSSAKQIKAVYEAARNALPLYPLEFFTHFNLANGSGLNFVYKVGTEIKFSRGPFEAYCRFINKPCKLAINDEYHPVRRWNPTPVDWSELGTGRFVVLDTETTGFDPVGGDAVEVGAVIVDQSTMEIVDRYQRIIYRAGKLDYEIVKLTGITDAMIKRDGVDPLTVWRQLTAFVADMPIVAHNSSFDKSFVDMGFVKTKLPLLKNRWVDSVGLMAKYLPDRVSYSLSQIAHEFHVSFKQKHRAMADVELVVDILAAIKRDHEAKGIL